MAYQILIGTLGVGVAYMIAENIWLQIVGGELTSYMISKRYDEGVDYLKRIPSIGPLSLYFKKKELNRLRELSNRENGHS